MFVSIIVDPGSIDSARSIASLLVNTGFKKVLRSCWENAGITEEELTDLKKDIDRVTDYYDNVRMYQFPLNGLFVITELKEKRWRRCQLSGSSGAKSSSVARRTAVSKAASGVSNKRRPQ